MPRLRQCLLDVSLGFAPTVHQDDWHHDDPLPGVAVMSRALARAIGFYGRPRGSGAGAGRVPERSALEQAASLAP